MMAVATRKLGVFWAGVAVLFVVVIVAANVIWQGIQEETNRELAATKIDSLETAASGAVSFVLSDLQGLPSGIVEEELSKRFEDADGQKRLRLAYGLAQYGRCEVELFVSSILSHDTPSDEAQNIVDALRVEQTAACSVLSNAAIDAQQREDWVALSRIAVTSIYLDDKATATNMVRASPNSGETTWNPIARTRFIDNFPDWSGDLVLLATILAAEEDKDLRSAIALAIGEIRRPTTSEREAWQSLLLDWFSKPDAGTHSASRWAMQQWGISLPEPANVVELPDDQEWWYHSDISLVKIAKQEPTGDSDQLSTSQDFWLSDCEMTVELFKQFIDEYSEGDLNQPSSTMIEDFNIGDDSKHPAQDVNWFTAVQFCNWLSLRHDLNEYYSIADSEEGLIVVEQPHENGYRLPTEREWQFACRTATSTKFSFGDASADLNNHGWFIGNSNLTTHPVRMRRCNAWGLFDMHGNVWEWCWSTSDAEEPVGVHVGGGFKHKPEECESLSSRKHMPEKNFEDIGFRVARNSN